MSEQEVGVTNDVMELLLSRTASPFDSVEYFGDTSIRVVYPDGGSYIILIEEE